MKNIVLHLLSDSWQRYETKVHYIMEISSSFYFDKENIHATANIGIFRQSLKVFVEMTH